MPKNNKKAKTSKKQKQSKKLKKYFGKVVKSTLPGQELLPPLIGLKDSSSQTLPAVLDYTMIDNTSVTEISLMRNDKFAPEIIQKIMNPEHVKKIVALREKNKVPELLSEGKKRIIYICKGIDSLKVHTSMFIVLSMMVIGRILNEIYTSLGSNRSEYAKWVKKNFGGHHRRYFQQARQLVAMGDFATKYSSLGKNRLLQINRVQDIEAYKEIIRDHPYPDISTDMKGKIFTEHTDAVISLYNLRQGGIDFAEYDQAYLLGTFNKQWIEQKTVKQIKDWLDKFPTIEEKKERFDDYIMNKMAIPSDREYQPVGNLQSLNKILADLVSFNQRYVERGETDALNSVDDKIWTDAVNAMNSMVKCKRSLNKNIAAKKQGVKK